MQPQGPKLFLAFLGYKYYIVLLCHPCFDVRARPVVLWPSRVSASHRSSPRWTPSGLTGCTSNGGRHKLEQRTQGSGKNMRPIPTRTTKSLKSCCLLKDFCCLSYWPLVLSGEVHFLGTRGHHLTMAVKVLPWKANVATINSHKYPEWDNLGKKILAFRSIPLPTTIT